MYWKSIRKEQVNEILKDINVFGTSLKSEEDKNVHNVSYSSTFLIIISLILFIYLTWWWLNLCEE